MVKRAHDVVPGPSIEWRTTMVDYIGLDVSLKETAISVRRDGKRVWRGKCASDPAVLAQVIGKRAPDAARAPNKTDANDATVWRSWPRSAFTVRFGSSGMTAC
jgi:hypothetical protein